MSESKSPSHHTRLGQWFATAICGNDILSSALYVSGIAIIFAGVFAPLVLLLIAVVLFFYKAVYTEVVEALPVNGGAYNCLLNSTTKPLAAGAGVMTVLSYVATAVLSAKVGVEYALSVLPIHEITIPNFT
jgi:amino acid transporter